MAEGASDMDATRQEVAVGSETEEGMNAPAPEQAVSGSEEMAAVATPTPTPEPGAAEEGVSETPPEIPELNNDSSSDSDSSASSDSDLEKIPVNEENPAPATAPAPAAPAPTAPATPNALFSGGQNHFIQGMKKNKTHRHHKRRNRHHTLRKK
jgi:hypothetical protein